MSDNLVNDVIELFKNDPYFKNFIEGNGISDQEIVDYYYTFKKAYDSICLCKNCKGLKECPQFVKGEVYYIDYQGTPVNVIKYCQHLKESKKYEELANKYVYSDVPKRLLPLNFDNIEPVDDHQQILFKLYEDILINKRRKGILVIGDYGVGKTYFSVALANSLVADGNKVAFIKTNSFVTEMATLVVNDFDAYNRLIDRIKNADFVIFDDIGTENVTEFSRDRLLFNILDYRMENRLCTVFTSNFNLSALQEHFSKDAPTNGERMCVRIKALADIYTLHGKDKREAQ